MLRSLLPDGSSWARTPGDRTGLFAQTVVLDPSPAEAGLEKRPALLTGADPLAFALAQLGPGDQAPAAGAPAAVEPEGVWQRAAKSGALAVLGLVLVAAGAFALTRGGE
jgi:hypothetical protein